MFHISRTVRLRILHAVKSMQMVLCTKPECTVVAYLTQSNIYTRVKNSTLNDKHSSILLVNGPAVSLCQAITAAP